MKRLLFQRTIIAALLRYWQARSMPPVMSARVQ
jgi:hypothetical protein